MVQLDGKTVEQIIEFFDNDKTGFKGLAFVPSFDLFPTKISDILNRFKQLGFKMPKRMPSIYNECIFIDLFKKELDVGTYDKYGIRIYSIVSTEMLEKILDHIYNK